MSNELHRFITALLPPSCAVRLTEVQRAGKKPMPAEEFLRGVKLGPGATVG